MQNPPALTNRDALDRNRRRARALPDPAVFLQEEAASEIKERLTLVNKAFTAPAIVTAWPEVWAKVAPGAVMVPDAETLALAEEGHDLIIHAMALHWANDPVGQLIQARRALRPDGLFLAATFGGQTLAELRAVLAEAEATDSGGLSPRVVPMAEIRDLGALLQRAGFALPVADSHSHTVTYETAVHLMRDIRAMGEGNAMAARRRGFSRRGLFETAAGRYTEAYAQRDGKLPATFEIIYLTGWAPDASQPQPLRPGSATARLADALGTNETALNTDD